MNARMVALAVGVLLGIGGALHARTGAAQQAGAEAANQALPSGFQTSPLLRSGMTADGRPVVYPRTETPEITAVIGTLAPNGRTARHQHPVPVFVYVMEGTLEVRSDGHPPRTYTAGQSFIESQNHWHQAFNTQNAPARILVVFMGEQGKPTSVSAQ
ncbi:cupin domain-containing protein [Caldovatus aquaticus]|uniref:Cupin domain-containing protein n=1 Tax=Caldovatus aquaticus TaxID=2865671 RepID=A0ABS7F6C0_9PROT|nr:cupin domain-containing protein [Caldovatus aquaticus]MBW8271171.1 cupin domain-containing protein [Caldovatus aquaticus]